MKLRHASLITALAFALATPTHAAITQVDTFESTSTTDGLDYSGIDASGLDFTGASKLVVTIGSEGAEANGTTPGSISTLTYGGEDLTLIASGNGGRSSVWYLDLAGATPSGTDLDLIFAGDNGATNTDTRGYYLSAYTLAGTATGVSTFGVTSSSITEISPASSGDYLIAGYSRNNTADPAVPVTAGLSVLGGSSTALEGQYINASIFGTLTSAGTQNIEITGMNGSGATVVTTFAAIPEPSVALLGGLGALLLFRRRR